MTKPIVEHGTNFPRSLGFKKYPFTKTRPANMPIANMGSAIGGIRDRTLLPQSTSIGDALSVYIDDDVRDKGAFDKQLTSRPVFPLFDRIKPFIDSIKSRAPMLDRRKVLGSFGLVGQGHNPSRRMALPGVGKNIPTPWKKREWSATRNIANLPSVVGNILVSGPTKTQYGCRALSVQS